MHLEDINGVMVYKFYPRKVTLSDGHTGVHFTPLSLHVYMLESFY